MNAGDHPFDTLSPDTVIDAVESVGLVSDARILALNSYENRVYQVGLEDREPVVVKFYRPHRWTDEQIQEEHDFTHQLYDLEIPVVPPLRGLWEMGEPGEPEESGESGGSSGSGGESDETLHAFAGFRFAVFPRRGGRSPDIDNLDNLRILGRYLGRIHRVGQVSAFRYRRTLSIEGFAEDSAAYLLEQDFIPPELVTAYSTLAQDLISRIHEIFRDVGRIPLLRIHGDCHMGNVLWRNELPHFVDFDDTMMAPAIQDLWMLLNGERDEQLVQLDQLIGGYTEFHDFNPRELVLIEALRTLRLMHYSAWLAKRWNDPAFPKTFTWFNTPRYWSDHILELREQRAALDEPPLTLMRS